MEAEVGENGLLRTLRPDTLELTYELAVDSDEDDGGPKAGDPGGSNMADRAGLGASDPRLADPAGVVGVGPEGLADDKSDVERGLKKQPPANNVLVTNNPRDESRSRRTRRESSVEGRLRGSEKLKHVRMAEEVIEHIPAAWEEGPRHSRTEVLPGAPAHKGILKELKEPLELRLERGGDEEHRARSRLKRPGRGRRRLSPTKPEMSGKWSKH